MGNKFELLNCDDHATILKKNGRNPGSSRPDITHQCLLMLLDSPLNRAGLLQIYMKTERNVLIEVNPQTRIPRTFPRFAGLMVQLLHKFSVRAAENSTILMKVIKNPITDHLPVGCKKYAMSCLGKRVESCELVPKASGDEDECEPIVLVVGAFAHGNLKCDYTEGAFSIDDLPLSAAFVCADLCIAFAKGWDIKNRQR